MSCRYPRPGPARCDYYDGDITEIDAEDCIAVIQVVGGYSRHNRLLQSLNGIDSIVNGFGSVNNMSRCCCAGGDLEIRILSNVSFGLLMPSLGSKRSRDISLARATLDVVDDRTLSLSLDGLNWKLRRSFN